MIQGLKLHAPNAGGLGLIPGQGTRAHMLGSMTKIKIKREGSKLSLQFSVWMVTVAPPSEVEKSETKTTM